MTSPQQTIFLDALDLSYLCSEVGYDFAEKVTNPFEDRITDAETLIEKLDLAFRLYPDKTSRHDVLLKILDETELSQNEIAKFMFWDFEKHYTRNLIHTDGENYTLLLLCWSPGKESMIHNHPCDGCYVKCMRGCLKETRYDMIQETNEITLRGSKFYMENQVSFMSDDLGLHKIGNPNKEHGAVSLHLYTPPFASCKVWSTPGEVLDKPTIAKVGYFTVRGHRSPHLEGKPGAHSRLLVGLRAHLRIPDPSNDWVI